MPSAEKVKAYKCKTCKGLGKLQDGSTCSYCQGSGYVGSDGTYEYILSNGENGKFIITDIKLPNSTDFGTNTKQQEQPSSPVNETQNTNKEWDKKMKTFWTNLVNALLIIGIVLVFFLYFVVFKDEKALITVGVILICLLLLFNLSRASLFDKLKEIVSRNWNEPHDYLYFLKEKRKRESE
ncbi:MAG: hypothetical protein WCO33_03665 [bacterium]